MTPTPPLQMKNIFISTFAFLLFACNAQTEKKPISIQLPDTTTTTLTTSPSEKFDTIIVDQQIQIIITKTYVDSYVSYEYNENGHTQIDNYNDMEIALTIKQYSQTILDTVFTKQQFSKHADEGFMDISVFHNYWFNKIDNNKIELFGVIGQPETDYVLAFYHYFDLKNNKLSFVEYIDEE